MVVISAVDQEDLCREFEDEGRPPRIFFDRLLVCWHINPHTLTVAFVVLRKEGVG